MTTIEVSAAHASGAMVVLCSLTAGQLLMTPDSSLMNILTAMAATGPLIGAASSLGVGGCA